MGLTAHTVREIAARRRLGATEPVPGCTCLMCAVFRSGGELQDVHGAERVVQILAELPVEDRHEIAEAIAADCRWRLPSARTLVRYAEAVRHTRVVAIALEPVAHRRSQQLQHHAERLPVEHARAVSILSVAERLGIKLRHVGRSWRGACPIHRGDGPNFSIDPERGLFHCFVCDEGGDGIELVRLALNLNFVDAVRWLL